MELSNETKGNKMTKSQQINSLLSKRNNLLNDFNDCSNMLRLDSIRDEIETIEHKIEVLINGVIS